MYCTVLDYLFIIFMWIHPSLSQVLCEWLRHVCCSVVLMCWSTETPTWDTSRMGRPAGQTASVSITNVSPSNSSTSALAPGLPTRPSALDTGYTHAVNTNTLPYKCTTISTFQLKLLLWIYQGYIGFLKYHHNISPRLSSAILQRLL